MLQHSSPLAYKSGDFIFVIDDDVSAVRENGEWREGSVAIGDLQAHYSTLPPKEAVKLLQAARAALGLG